MISRLSFWSSTPPSLWEGQAEVANATKARGGLDTKRVSLGHRNSETLPSRSATDPPRGRVMFVVAAAPEVFTV